MKFHLEDLLLYGALLSGLAGFLAAFFHIRGQGVDHYVRAQRLAAVTAALLSVATFVLLWHFVTVNLSIEYVHSYTHTEAPLAYRIAGLWGGQKGTLLLWATFAALLVAVNAYGWQRKVGRGELPPPDRTSPLPWILLVGLGIVLAFTLLLLLGGTFDRTDDYLRTLQPDGKGLQPVLRTPFMVIHPPLQFFGYALAVLLFACGISSLATNRKEWADVALPWARLAFLVSWIGLGLGGLWAYYVLNFGGYWAWDPVETANLLTFFPLIVLVHALIYYRKKGMFSVLAPLFAILTFIATLFSTLATRTGLWVSVHAFTDPSQNFSRDPLRRLLNILDTGFLVQYLTGLFLASIGIALLAYLWRVQADYVREHGERPRGLVPVLLLAGLFAAATFVLFSLLDPRAALSLVFQAAHLVYAPNASLGLALLVFGLTVLFALPALFAKEETEPTHTTPRLERWLVMSNLVFVGMLIVALAYLVTFLLDVMSVNGYRREVYDARAPLLVLPLLLVLGVALSNAFIGRSRSLYLAGAALLLGLLLTRLEPDHWELWLVAPALAFAFFASLLKLFKVSDSGPTMNQQLRLAGAILLLGGVAGIAYWANPPTRMPFPGLTIYPSAWWVLWGFPASILSLLGAVATLRQRNLRLATLGSLGLAASAAWLVGLPAGIFAFLLIRRHVAQFHEGRGAWNLASTFRANQREFRKTGVYLIHVSLVLGLAGYGFSTYLATATDDPDPETGFIGQPVALALGQTKRIQGYDYTLMGSNTEGLDPDQLIVEEVHAKLRIAKNGVTLSEVPLVMWLELPAHYAERVEVERLATEDLYLRPAYFNTTGPGGPRNFTAHEDNVQLFPQTQVTTVGFHVKRLPGMHLVWTGLWGIGTGMVLSLAFGGFRFEAKAKASRRSE